jgi:hypothetical protein
MTRFLHNLLVMSPTRPNQPGVIIKGDSTGCLNWDSNLNRWEKAMNKRNDLMKEAESFMSKHSGCVEVKTKRPGARKIPYIDENILECIQKAIIDFDTTLDEFVNQKPFWRYVASLILERHTVSYPDGPQLSFSTADLSATWRRLRQLKTKPEGSTYTGKYPIDLEEFWNMVWIKQSSRNNLPEMSEATKWLIFADIDNFTTKELVKKDHIQCQITSEDCYAIASGMDYRDLENSEKFLPWIDRAPVGVDDNADEELLATTNDLYMMNPDLSLTF